MIRYAVCILTLLAASGQAENFEFEKAKPLGDGYYIRNLPFGGVQVSTGPELSTPGWTALCEVDPMTDVRDCSVFHSSADLIINVDPAGIPKAVCIGRQKHPTYRAMLRVDQFAAQQADEEGCIPPSSVMWQLVKGKTFIARRYEWPSEGPIDAKHSLDGLAKIMRMIVTKQLTIPEFQNPNLR